MWWVPTQFQTVEEPRIFSREISGAAPSPQYIEALAFTARDLHRIARKIAITTALPVFLIKLSQGLAGSWRFQLISLARKDAMGITLTRNAHRIWPNGLRFAFRGTKSIRDQSAKPTHRPAFGDQSDVKYFAVKWRPFNHFTFLLRTTLTSRIGQIRRIYCMRAQTERTPSLCSDIRDTQTQVLPEPEPPQAAHARLHDRSSHDGDPKRDRSSG
ncbi:hypothetical protein [uncultured Roseobacter sp.]|uniref:hypothetical protein n=1 Tax=uncultured Roseobacter sp. TaxID=114847 RepID=UPI0026267DC8|nr:hypothetical protein [uncultured Roseobacter sp.]